MDYPSNDKLNFIRYPFIKFRKLIKGYLFLIDTKYGCMPITIPKHEPIKKVYVEMVRQIVESEAKNDEDAE